MPMFIKMGLNGTGYLGKKENDRRKARRFAARRRALPGYPAEEPFVSIEAVRQYLSGENIICLLCGKSYRRIGTHIKSIHGMSIEKYKQKYNIPWTYGLICTDSSALYAKAMQSRISEGFLPPIKVGWEHDQMIQSKKRDCPFKREIALQNLCDMIKPKHPLSISPAGELETFTAKRERETSARGTEKFIRKMQRRPQCQPEVVGKRLGDYWRGRKQTPEHIAKRFAYKTKRAQPENPADRDKSDSEGGG